MTLDGSGAPAAFCREAACASVRKAVWRRGCTSAGKADLRASSWVMKTLAPAGAGQADSAAASPAAESQRGTTARSEQVADRRIDLVRSGAVAGLEVLRLDLDRYVRDRTVAGAEGDDLQVVGPGGGEAGWD